MLKAPSGDRTIVGKKPLNEKGKKKKEEEKKKNRKRGEKNEKI